ncbi:MAG: hypothetical protein ABIV51_02750 [Saprospiraceae bacterium]
MREWIATECLLFEMNTGLTYPAKLLLFGEYAILHGADGLAVPLTSFQGHWTYSVLSNDHNAQRQLPEFSLWLTREMPEVFGDGAFLKAVETGIWFESDIPEGCGIGSSGSLVAAVLAEFGDKTYLQTIEGDLLAIKATLAKMECFFHGSSSGFDPLVSYVNKPVHIKDFLPNVISGLPELAGIHFFLIHSGETRITSQWVNHFNDLMLGIGYYNAFIKGYIPVHQALMDAYFSGDSAAFYARFQILSVLQRDIFADMIPPNLQNIWQSGISSGQYCLKLCGAGGGGYFMGITADLNILKQFQAKGFNCLPIQF